MEVQTTAQAASVEGEVQNNTQAVSGVAAAALAKQAARILSNDTSDEPAHVKATRQRKGKTGTPAAGRGRDVPAESFLNIMEFAGTRGAVAFSTTARKEKTLTDVKLRCRIGACSCPTWVTCHTYSHRG